MQTQREKAWRIDSPQEGDWTAIAQLEREAGLSIWGEQTYRREAARALLLVARATDGALCGFIIGYVVGATLEIGNFAVAERWRRRGIGKALFAALGARARAQGARAVTLEVRASNLAAQRFYARCGLRVVGRRRAYYRDPVEDALVMSGQLDEEKTVNPDRHT